MKIDKEDTGKVAMTSLDTHINIQIDTRINIHAYIHISLYRHTT